MAPTICPHCGERPRRKPGDPCSVCYAEWQRKRRAERRAGAPKKTIVPVERSAKRFTRKLSGVRRLLITSAQNATKVHAEFFETLKVAAEEMGAELIVIPLRYKNPTSIWTSRQQDDEWWDPAVEPYLHNTRKKLCAHLVLAADVKIQPTAISPLTGFEALTGAESCIIGSPKMQFRTVAAPSGRFPKILSTTGACTERNYTDTKAGKLGAFHHFLGAVVVEIDRKHFHLRQVNADRSDGSFIDLDKLYTRQGVKPAPPALGIVFGDIHAKFIDPEVERATFGKGGICDVLKPRARVWSDTLDGYAVNPHHHGNPFIAEAKSKGRLGNIREEVEHAVKFVADRTPPGSESVIVASNHDDFLARWILGSDWKHAGPNREFYLETALAMHRSVRSTPNGTEYADPFKLWVERLRGKAKIRCLDVNESYQVGGVECGMHGDRGPNGSKGTIKNLARIGARVISGHTHSPGIEEGHYKTGTSTPLRLEYCKGPSSWINAHALVYASGKRALILVIDGKWRA